jgi:hypothetical protein
MGHERPRGRIAMRIGRRGWKVATRIWKEARTNGRIARTYVLNRRRYRAVANPYAVLLVDPRPISKKLVGGWYRRQDPQGTILAGVWDQEVTIYDESPKCRGVVERFTMDIPWEGTSLFREHFARRLEEEGKVAGLCSLDELGQYYRRHVDPLFEALRSHGFRPPSFWHRIPPAYAYIDRSGEFLWGPGGNHRLAMAKILDIERIPVRIHLRHALWQEVRECVVAEGDIPAQIGSDIHPDLWDLRDHLNRRNAV